MLICANDMIMWLLYHWYGYDVIHETYVQDVLLELYDGNMLDMIHVDRYANCCLWEMMIILPMRIVEYSMHDIKRMYHMIDSKEEYEHDVLCVCIWLKRAINCLS